VKRRRADLLAAEHVAVLDRAAHAGGFDRSDLGLSRFAGLLSQLGANLFTLEWRTGFPTDADLIVIAGPVADLAPDQIARLWAGVPAGSVPTSELIH